MRFIPIVLKVVAAVEEQYLSTNILQEGVMERPLLPPNLEAIRLEALKGFYTVNFFLQRLTTLPGNLVLMVEQGLDIGNPAYGQLQKLHKVEARK